MAIPVRHDLTLYKGQTFRQGMKIKNAKTKLPVDLTGITAKSEIRPSENSAILTATFDVTVYPEHGRIVLALDPETSGAMDPGFYHWDLKLLDSNEDVAYWIAGQFIVIGRVTV